MISLAFFPLFSLSCICLIIWLVFTVLLEKRKRLDMVDLQSLPDAAVIIPVAGYREDMKTYLSSLIHQNYPSFKIYFVTQNESDPATPVITELIANFNHVSLIHAGEAVSCSQKNWNIIAGSKAAVGAEVLVFCDSGHFAEPDWLTQLVSPLVRQRNKIISSGYHQVIVGNSSLSETGRAICVHTLRFARMIPGFEQPWGGAMAMTREVFDTLKVAELWSSTVVDDVTLAKHLQNKGFRTHIPAGCDMNTYIHNHSWTDWSVWLTRQWAYLKFIFPLLWFFLGFFGLLFTMATLYCLTALLLFPFIAASPGAINGALVAAGLLVIFSILLRLSHPAPGALLLWFPGFIAALIMAGWCHFKTWFAGSISWTGITYEVKFGGQVTKIIRP